MKQLTGGRVAAGWKEDMGALAGTWMISFCMQYMSVTRNRVKEGTYNRIGQEARSPHLPRRHRLVWFERLVLFLPFLQHLIDDFLALAKYGRSSRHNCGVRRFLLTWHFQMMMGM